jgi:hypothetical protein
MEDRETDRESGE